MTNNQIKGSTHACTIFKIVQGMQHLDQNHNIQYCLYIMKYNYAYDIMKHNRSYNEIWIYNITYNIWCNNTW